MKCTLLAACVSTALAGGILGTDSAMSCQNEDFGMRSFLQSKVGGTDCEGMCKRLGAYPKCQCPGFNGEPASSDDTRACFVSYCQDPSAPCPNDAFVGCVKENTKAFLQWQAVFGRISHGFDSMLQVARLANATKGVAPNPKPYTKAPTTK